MIVVDASVALKWVAPEEESDKALALYGQNLRAPDLITIEVGNALWKKVTKGEYTSPQIPDAFRMLNLGIARFESSPPLVRRAFELAIELSHPIYDCIYLALAERDGGICVTADRRFAIRCEASSYGSLVRRLDLLS